LHSDSLIGGYVRDDNDFEEVDTQANFKKTQPLGRRITALAAMAPNLGNPSIMRIMELTIATNITALP